MSARIEIPEGEAAGQNERRWIRLRNLIDTYPKDSGILKELIQNADDGQAQKMRIVLDERLHHDHPLARDESLRLLCGPAILAFNDQPFRDQDFTNLQNLANSAKIEDAFKTGRYGLGFNSVYNVTDFPILLTGEKLWCLDPCETLLKEPAGGKIWKLRDLKGNPFESITSLFEAIGHQVGNERFPATAIRLPLRAPEHVQFNQDPEQPNGTARISSTSFLPEEFAKLVKGLSEIAHEVLLFLKNVESVTCERIAENGESEVLLKIEITNPTEVREAREKFNAILKVGLENALKVASSAPNGALESSFGISVCVTLPGGKVEESDWLVSAGLFAGKDNCLVKLSQDLTTYGERGLPHSGAAICLKKGAQRFPKVEGRVFCYLPIASDDYTGMLPVHIHGAFSVENSRTSLTSHRSDEQGKQKLLAQWNDLLLKEGVASAYASAVSQLTLLQSITLPSQDRAKAIYQLFPSSLEKLSAHHRTLVEQVVRELATRPVFLDVHGNWQPASKLRQFDEDADLEKCLATEGFVFARPRPPQFVERLLQEAKCPLPKLSSAHIRDHFDVDQYMECEIETHPFPGLRSRTAIVALVRFLIALKEDFWSGLPLGLAQDGRVYAFSVEGPLLIGTPRHRRILSICPQNLAAPEINELWNTMGGQVPTGVSRAVPTVWLPILAAHFKEKDANLLTLEVSGKDFPNVPWLKDVLDELNDLSEDEKLDNKLIDAVPLVPDDAGALFCPGTASTPLLLQLNEKSAGTFLDALGVRYRVLAPQNALTKPLTVFRDKYERVWSLHPADLIDSIHASLDELTKEPRTWAKRQIVEPLLVFLERTWVAEEMGDDEDRLAKLRVLPIFEDSTGSFGVVDESCFSTGSGFTPPKSMGHLRLIRGHVCQHVLKSLGVVAFSRRALLEKSLLPHYEDQTPEVRRDWLRWIRDEWNGLIGEFEYGNLELVELLEDESLVQTETGALLPAKDCYHSFEKQSIKPILGDVAAFPDMSLYLDDPDFWIHLFDKLGIQRRPATQHLADRVCSLMETIEEAGLEKASRASLIGVAGHIFSYWHQHSLNEIEIGDKTRCQFGEFLRTEPWLPAASGFELEKYLGANEPELRLYEPLELSPYALGHLVASVRPLLPRELMASKDFGISFSPPWQDVASHFENLLELAGSDPLSDKVLGELIKPIKEIYRFFGQHGGQAADEAEIEEQLDSIAERFAETPCILIPPERQFFLPEDVYRSGRQGLRPLKYVLADNDPFVEKGLEILGRRAEATVDDLTKALHRLAAQQQEGLAADMQAAVTRCLEIIGEKLADDANGNGLVPDILVLNAASFLVPPNSVIMLDSTTPIDSLEIGPEEILDLQTPQRVIQLWKIRHCREAKLTPVEFEDSLNNAFVGECQKLQERIKHPAFLEGLARIVYHQEGTVPAALDWLADMIIQPCRALRCDHELTMGTGVRSLGTWAEDCCLHSIQSGERLLVDEIAFEEDVLLEKFGDRLAILVSDKGLANLTTLVKILHCPSSSIDKILTKLGVRSLPPSIPDDPGMEGELSTDYFSGGEDDSNDELEGESKEEADNQIDEQAEDEPEEDDGSDPDVGQEYESDRDEDEDSEEGGVSGSGDDVDGESDQNEPATTRPTGSGNRSSSGQQGGGSTTSRSNGVGAQGGAGRGGRAPNTETTVRTHRRMLPGQGNATHPPGQPRAPGRRQQDAIWISRPAPQQPPHDPARSPVDTQDDEERPNHSIGRAAVGLVIAFERSQGRKPQNMAHANAGYDIESCQGRVLERYIEVKGIDGEWGANGVPLSLIQMKYAREKGDAYWLYVVENARDPESARIHMIQNPAAKISQFRFDCGWHLAGTSARTNQLPKPEVGRRIRIFEDDGSFKEGEVTEVQPSDTQIFLKVRYEVGIPAKTELFDLTYMQLL